MPCFHCSKTGPFTVVCTHLHHLKLATGFLLCIQAIGGIGVGIGGSSVAMAAEDSGRIDRARSAISASTNQLAQRLDNLFDDPAVAAEAASTRLKLGQSFTFSELDASEYDIHVKAKVNLPRLSRRLSLIIDGDDEAATQPDDDDELLLDHANPETLENPSVGLQYVTSDAKAFHSSIAVRARVGNPSVNVGPRLRFQHNIGQHWQGRYTQILLWDTHDKFEARTRLDFNRKIGTKHLFRQTLVADWRDKDRDDEGARYTLRTSLYHTVSDRSAFSYDYTSRFTSRPRHTWVSHMLSVRYRRAAYRDWVFFEIAPFVAFQEEHDWHANAGLQLTLDLIFED